jgi:hypothetical protein
LLLEKQQIKSREHVLRIDDDNYYAIKQLTVIMGCGYPVALINQILKEYIAAHKDLLLTEKEEL